MSPVGFAARRLLGRDAAPEAEHDRRPCRDDGEEREEDDDGQRLGQ
jgi:hypothetical protein